MEKYYGRPDTRRSSVRSLSLSSDAASRHYISDAGSLRTVTTSSFTTSTSSSTPSNDTLMTPNESPVSQQPQTRKSMWFAEMNPFAPETIIMIHILFSCHLEWKQVWPKLAEYHLLVPDLPCHSRSKGVCRKDEFSVELCADLLADLIRSRAHDGRAHVVGLSTGGFIAMELIRRHPDVVASAMICGACPVQGMRAKSAEHPRLTYAALWSILHSPGYMFFKASGLGGEYQNNELLSEIKKNGSARLLKAAAPADWKDDRLNFGNSGIPLCFVGGGKFDNASDCQRAVDILRSQGGGVDIPLYMVRDGIHAWNLQFPLVFARGIRAFIEGRPMPPEFEVP